MKAKVKSIINDEVKRGTGKKGEWTMSEVQLDDGQKVRIFNPVKVGDEVESYQSGDFTNWKVLPIEEGEVGSNTTVGNISAEQQALNYLEEIRDLLRALAGRDG